MESDLHPNPDITPAADLTAAPGSIWAIIAGVFTSPTKAFTQFVQKPRLLIPLLAVIVISSLVGIGSGEYGARVQYDMMKTSTVMPPQVLEQMRQDAENPNLIQLALMTPAMMVFGSVLAALVAWFLGAVIFGGQAKFKAIWAVGLLADLIVHIGGLLRLPLVHAKGTMYVSYGLAALFPDKDFTSIGYSLLYYLDVFAVWAIIVAGIGYGAVFGITRGRGLAVSIIATLLLIILIVTLSVVGMSFAGVEVTLF